MQLFAHTVFETVLDPYPKLGAALWLRTELRDLVRAPAYSRHVLEVIVVGVPAEPTPMSSGDHVMFTSVCDETGLTVPVKAWRKNALAPWEDNVRVTMRFVQ